MANKNTSPSCLPPNLQVSFYYRLQNLKSLYLEESLKETVKDSDLAAIDKQLSKYADRNSLQKIASFGIRGEVIFAVPCLLEKNPYLLGYYRLLLGFSQKEFYSKGPFGKFKKMEEDGNVTTGAAALLPDLCRSLCGSAAMLIDGIDDISISIVKELQLLTIGPQLRGSENTRLGKDATKEVYELISLLVEKYTKERTERTILVHNDSGSPVMIEFFSDPDVSITQKLRSGIRPLVSMEIKGGSDFSNVHNRIGEAEKSHQKAKEKGFFEFWTIIRVEIEDAKAKQESPTTSHFFNLEKIKDPRSEEHQKFRELLGSIIGIRPARLKRFQ